jgi:hypothetical protein
VIEYFIKFGNHLNGFVLVYLHCAIYRDGYNFFINIFFNHLISISKWEFFLEFFFLGFELFVENLFNIGLA